MMKKPLLIVSFTACIALSLVSMQARAGDPVAGALIGGGIGAAIGGPPGAAVGAILGSLAGSDPYYDRRYYDRGGYGPAYREGGYYEPAPAYYPPRPAYYAPQPAYYAPPVYYGPSVYYSSPGYYAPRAHYRSYPKYTYAPRREVHRGYGERREGRYGGRYR